MYTSRSAHRSSTPPFTSSVHPNQSTEDKIENLKVDWVYHFKLIQKMSPNIKIINLIYFTWFISL